MEKMKRALPWKETLDITVDVAEMKDAQDDIKRELALWLFLPIFIP